MALDISIDREKCMGSGNCSFWAPNVFDLDDDGIAVVIDAAPNVLDTKPQIRACHRPRPARHCNLDPWLWGMDQRGRMRPVECLHAQKQFPDAHKANLLLRDKMKGKSGAVGALVEEMHRRISRAADAKR